jgi:hypothetical protein
MGSNKHLTLFIALLIGFSLIVGTSSAATYYKKTSVYDYQMQDKDVNGHYYSYYKNNFIKITLGSPYVNGYVYGKNPVTGKYENAPVYSRKLKVTPLSSNVKIKTNIH